MVNFNPLSFFIYLFFLILLISLGFWQMDRADQKSLFLDKQQQSADQPTIKLTTVLDVSPEDLRFKKVEITGQYDQEHQYLIDNQIQNGKVGYFVMTPFKIEGTEQAVLINRGWVLLNKDRRILPNISISTLKQTLSGRINNFPSVGIVLANAEIPTQGWPSVVQVVDINILSNKLGYALHSFQVELDSDMDEGYYREWTQNAIMPTEKHIAYAMQWFGLALTLTLLFFWFNRITDERTT